MLKIRISFNLTLAGQSIPVSHCYLFPKKIYLANALKEIDEKKVLIFYTNKNNKLMTYSKPMKIATKKAYYYKLEVWRVK